MGNKAFCTLYMPGDVVDWRPGPFDSWSPATVVAVHHELDRVGTYAYTEISYTEVTVEPHNGDRTLGKRMLIGATLATCLRPRQDDEPAASWNGAAHLRSWSRRLEGDE